MIKKLTDFFALVIIVLALATASDFRAQTKVIITKNAVSAVSVQDFKLKSKLMNREMPYRVIFPVDYETEKTAKYPVVYLLHGLTGHYTNWVDASHLKQYAANYRYIIVSVEGDNGWYTDSATAADDKYESYLIKELIPEIEGKFRVVPDKDHRAAAGLSMGGYGALKFGLKYPQMFAVVGSFSGALPAASWSDKNLGKNWKALTDSIMSVYGADGSQTRTDNDIFKMVKEITPEKIKSLPFIYQSCGTEDILIQSNHEFAALLFEKKIPHEYREHPGIHNFNFWDDQIKEFLETSADYLK